MVTADLLTARRDAIATSADLTAMRSRLSERAAPVRERLPTIPAAKALLSQDGGLCPEDGSALTFDPWSPDAHRCPRCGAVQRGARHDRWWARWQHLWNAERAAELAALAALGDDGAGAQARALLAAYGERYFSYPNSDNVLGPSRLFFSTYLESLWIGNYLAAAVLLRSADQLGDETAKLVTQVADEAANLIGEFGERFSNRQTWNNAALAAVAVWFADADLMRHALEDSTGLLAHLTEGFRPDGMWYEGENYHLFALRGLVTGLAWARVAGVDIREAAPLADRLTAALLAPARTALPDLTFPARKDSRFGVSLAQPMYLDTWEVGLAMLAGRDAGDGVTELASWLRTLYAAPAPAAQTTDAYLHEAGREAPATRVRADLSWWAGLAMLPELPAAEAPWSPSSMLFEYQGLAVLRTGGRYASLECGPYAGGHAHADRLHLTLHDGHVHWLPDPGTGSYVSRDLFWYRSTLAHNAPRLDGVSQDPVGADCLAFDAVDEWAWAVGRFGDVRRTVVAGARYVLDLVELAAEQEHTLEVPWHFAGRVAVTTPGTWSTGELPGEALTRIEEFTAAGGGGPIELTASAAGRTLAAQIHGATRIVAAEAPGVPGADRATVVVARVEGRAARLLTVVVPGPDEAGVGAVRWSGDVIEVDTASGTDRHRAGGAAWIVETPAGRVSLAGRRDASPAFTPFLVLEPHHPIHGEALGLADEPLADGTLAGFDTAAPLTLDLEDQYRRSEEPYPGPEDFSATAWANWTDEALFVAVEVTKADPWFRPADAPPLRLDNETDDIHSDGLQIYLREREGRGVAGWLLVPEDGGRLRIRPAGDAKGESPELRGAWRPTASGYRVTLRVGWPAWISPHPGAEVGFDVLVNEMLPERERRAGQLVWSGGNGWVYLRGDRQDPERLGVLELVG